MTPILILLAYLLPLPIAFGCFYYNIFSGVEEPLTRLLYIGVASVVPSALIMVLVLKRVVHFIIKLLLIGGVLYGLHSAGVIGQSTAPQTTQEAATP